MRYYPALKGLTLYFWVVCLSPLCNIGAAASPREVRRHGDSARTRRVPAKESARSATCLEAVFDRGQSDQWKAGRSQTIAAIGSCGAQAKREKARVYLALHWSGREDLNLRPPSPQLGALPDCATPRPSALIIAESKPVGYSPHSLIRSVSRSLTAHRTPVEM